MMNASKGHVRAGVRACSESGNQMKDEGLLPLVQGTIAGDPRARDALWRALGRRVERIAGRWRLTSRLARSEDDRRNIVVRVMTRLFGGGTRLKDLHEVLLRGDGSGWPWIVLLVQHLAIDY